MKEYLLVYRADYSQMPQTTNEAAQAVTKTWMDWMQHMEKQNQLVSAGNRLDWGTGKTIKPNNVVVNGPYAEIKESIGGYSVIKANSYETALEIAKGCPILQVGGNVEIREIVKM